MLCKPYPDELCLYQRCRFYIPEKNDCALSKGDFVKREERLKNEYREKNGITNLNTVLTSGKQDE